MITHAFTCTGPFAILIMLGIKRVVNWNMIPCQSSGRCAIGCSKSFCKEEFGAFVQWASQTLSLKDFRLLPSWSDVENWPGKIVGSCDYVCGADSGDGRRNGGYPYWWSFSNIVGFERPIPCSWNEGIWLIPAELSAVLNTADVLGRAEGEKVVRTEDAVRIFAAAFPVVKDAEGVFVLPLDDSRRVISAPILVSLGDRQTAAIQVGDVFASALKVDAKAVILAHNHPSGNLTPSSDDIEVTNKLIVASELVNVSILDHIVFGYSDSTGEIGYRSIIGAMK